MIGNFYGCYKERSLSIQIAHSYKNTKLYLEKLSVNTLLNKLRIGLGNPDKCCLHLVDQFDFEALYKGFSPLSYSLQFQGRPNLALATPNLAQIIRCSARDRGRAAF